MSNIDNSFAYTRGNLKRPDHTVYNPVGAGGSQYQVIQDDSLLNRYIEGLRYDNQTYPLFERLTRKHSLIKDNVFGVKIKQIEEVKKRAAAEKKENKPRINFVNY